MYKAEEARTTHWYQGGMESDADLSVDALRYKAEESPYVSVPPCGP
jgi:hypothetical protein